MLLGKTREIELVKNEEQERIEKLQYSLYEGNYISGIREIFKEAFKTADLRKDEKERILLDEKRNVFAFIGKRGSGKTTAMNEFCQILKNMDEDSEIEKWVKQSLEEIEKKELLNKTFKFHVLKPIDASLLEEKENLFELILANIYLEFKDSIAFQGKREFECCEKPRDCMRLFSELFKSYRSINGHSNEDDEYGNFIISKMQFLRGSQQLQEKVVELVELLFSLSKRKYDYEYIVIAIDDLDLNIRHGYEMLEQLQKYFSYYKILLLIAVDYEQMERVCEEHFRKEMKETTIAYKNDGQEHVQKLTNDYMTKMFHYSQRMYMPDAQKFSRKSEIITKDGRIEVKNFVANKIVESMRIFYDTCGSQRHFSEPVTVRGLVSYNEFLESLNVIEYDKLVAIEKIDKLYEGLREEVKDQNEKILRLYDQNHERFNQDINVRMAQNIMLPYQKSAFELLNTQPIEHRAQLFISAYRKENKIQFQSVANKAYSYGELLGKINAWGRDKEIGGNYLEDKPFIRGILASLTSELVREYLYYRYKPVEGKNKYKTRLLSVLGNSFGSMWTGEAFPKVRIEINGEPKLQKGGYARGVEQRDLNIYFDTTCLEEISEENKSVENVCETVKKWLEEELVIESLEYIDMFFVHRAGDLYQGMEYEFSCDYSMIQNGDKKEEGKKQIRVTGTQGKTNFDMLAFVAKSMNYEEEKKRLHTNLIEGLTSVVGEKLDCINGDSMMKEIKRTIEVTVKRKTLFNQLEKMEEGYEVAFPFYNLDMTYNVMKRVRKENEGKTVRGNEFLEGVLEFYKCIEGYLEKEEENYQISQSFKYRKIFNESPYIKAIRQIDTMQEKNKISERLEQMFRTMVVEEKPEDIMNDRSAAR